MNKEFEQDWNEPIASADVHTAEPKQHAAAAQKQIVTIRLDIDMLDWFKAGGPGYQTRINQVLRDHMQAQRDELAQ